jgi:hypothetical protein
MGVLSLKSLYLGSYQIPIRPVPCDPARYPLERPVQLRGIAVNHGALDDRLLVCIAHVRFCDREIEFASHSRHQRHDPPALLFERGAAGQVQVNEQAAYQG